MSRVLYVGNFAPPNSTENDVRRAFEHLGWEVDRCEEKEFIRAFATGAYGPVYDRALSADLLIHTLTQGSYPDPVAVLDLWAACARSGIPTASIHLDLFYGLASAKGDGPQRHALPREHPMFKVAYVFTADGGHDAEFARDGVNHHWLPPGVNHEEAIDVEPWLGPDDNPDDVPEFVQQILTDAIAGRYTVGFAGSDGYHPEWPHRPQLVRWLRDTYGDRFLHIGGSSTPRITGLALNRVLASVPVWVGDSCLTAPDNAYWSDRISETWGRGGFLVHPRVDALNDRYGEALPGTAWEAGDWDALHAVIDHFVTHADAREQIRDRIVARTRAHDTYVHRVAEMLDTIGLDSTRCACHFPAAVRAHAPGLVCTTHESLLIEPWAALPGGIRIAHMDDPDEAILLLRDRDEVDRVVTAMRAALEGSSA